MSAKTDGPRRRGRGDVEEALLLTRGRNGENVPLGGCLEGLTTGCEYPQNTGGCHLLGVTPPPCSECWAISILWLRRLSPGEVRVTQTASDRGAATTGCLAAEHLLSPRVPTFSHPRAQGCAAHCYSPSGRPWGPQPVRHPDSAASQGPALPRLFHPVGQPCLQAPLPTSRQPLPWPPSRAREPSGPAWLPCTAPSCVHPPRSSSRPSRPPDGMTSVPASRSGVLSPWLGLGGQGGLEGECLAQDHRE